MEEFAAEGRIDPMPSATVSKSWVHRLSRGKKNSPERTRTDSPNQPPLESAEPLTSRSDIGAQDQRALDVKRADVKESTATHVETEALLEEPSVAVEARERERV
eukprot:SAG31_NODE_8513_length_1438_cov_1.302465_1_plen_104_part_00